MQKLHCDICKTELEPDAPMYHVSLLIREIPCRPTPVKIVRKIDSIVKTPVDMRIAWSAKALPAERRENDALIYEGEVCKDCARKKVIPQADRLLKLFARRRRNRNGT